MNKARINEFAVAAFTLGVMSFIQLAGIEKAVGAIVFGVLALKKIAAADNEQRGEGLAAAAIVLGVIYALIAVFFLVTLFKNPEILEKMLKSTLPH
ncbi:MAG: DUF4190 domain-containing protein [Candidatus Omnitrophota bacterium]